jgi:hypothetical protein
MLLTELVYCVSVTFTNLLPFNGDFSSGKSGKFQETKSRLWGGWQTWVMWCFAEKSLHESCRMGRCSVMMKLICLLGDCECDGHTVHKLSQRRLTADCLVRRESDCSQMHTKVSSDRLPSYIKAMWPVLEIFKIDRYLTDSPHSYLWSLIHLCGMVFNYQFLTQQLCFCVFSWKSPLWQYTIGWQHFIVKK